MIDNFSRNDIKTIHDKLGDDISKYIFSNRLMYGVTDDDNYLLNVILQTSEAHQLKDKLYTPEKKVIFGAATLGRQIFRFYKNCNWGGFIDNRYKKPTLFEGLPIMNLKDFMLRKGEEISIVVASFTRYEEMIKELKETGFQEENIVNAGFLMEQMSSRQYFDLPELKSRMFEKEIFVDGGCFDGNTSLGFEKWAGDKADKIYAFEPDVDNVCKVKNKLNTGVCDIEVIEKGLWKNTTKLNFDQRGTAGSLISENGSTSIPVTSIDDTVQDKVTFIKMDIEGSEYQALLGAKRIIDEYKPRLAISIYHKPEDILKIPLLILSLNSEYRLYLRHYSLGPDETVLYAI